MSKKAMSKNLLYSNFYYYFLLEYNFLVVIFT